VRHDTFTTSSLPCVPLWYVRSLLCQFVHVGCICYYIISHTHPFNGPFSGTTQVSWYQKGKTNLDFTVARDSEWQWHQLDHMQDAPRSRQITTPAPNHAVFYRLDAFHDAQPTASKHCRHISYQKFIVRPFPRGPRP